VRPTLKASFEFSENCAQVHGILPHFMGIYSKFMGSQTVRWVKPSGVRPLARRGRTALKRRFFWRHSKPEEFARRPVSRVLFFILSFIWDCCHQQPRAAYPLRLPVPLRKPKPVRAALCSEELVIYLALQSMRRTANHVAMTTGRLLPHLFTLTPIFTGAVIFCYTTANLRPPSR